MRPLRKCLMAMLWLLWCGQALAAPLAVRVSGPEPLAGHFATLLSARAPGIAIVSGQVPADLVVTVGARAFEEAVAAATRPVFGVALARHAFQSIAGRGTGRHSALFWEPDPVRHLRLARAIMPGARRAGVLLSDDGHADLAALRSEARRIGLELVVERLPTEGNLTRHLTTLLRQSDFLLAVDDPVVFSPTSVKVLLLTSYRLGKPVFGPGAAYVDAGSVAAVTVTLEDVADTLAAWLRIPDASQVTLPPPRHADGHAVKTNPRVARSLGLALPPGGNLEAFLLEAAP